MGHMPYGYRIENGKAAVDDIAAEQVKELFSGYLAGLVFLWLVLKKQKAT